MLSKSETGQQNVASRSWRLEGDSDLEIRDWPLWSQLATGRATCIFNGRVVEQGDSDRRAWPGRCLAARDESVTRGAGFNSLFKNKKFHYFAIFIIKDRGIAIRILHK